MSFLVDAIIILPWYIFVHKRRDVPNAKQFELPNMSQTINSADKSAKRKVAEKSAKRTGSANLMEAKNKI